MKKRAHTSDATQYTLAKDEATCSKSVSESELDCNHFALVVEQPIQLEESDKAYINRLFGEVLIYPKDETNDEDWIQENLIDPSGQEKREGKVLYAKKDAIKLRAIL